MKKIIKTLQTLFLSAVMLTIGACGVVHNVSAPSENGSDVSDIPPDTSLNSAPDADEYVNTTKYRPSYTVGIDDLGRTLTVVSSENTERKDRQVGIFYFLWIGFHGTALYDNSEIVSRDPTALRSESDWINAGGGAVNAFHFWGKPMFGYYPSNEKWVMRKHVHRTVAL